METESPILVIKLPPFGLVTGWPDGLHSRGVPTASLGLGGGRRRRRRRRRSLLRMEKEEEELI